MRTRFVVAAGGTTMALLYADRATAQAADTVRRARLRADRRLTTQVLTTGQAAVKQQWALEVIGRCGENAVDAIARVLRENRSATTKTGKLDGLVYQASTVIAPRDRVGRAQDATDPSAGKVTRVQALRILSFQVNPGRFASYEKNLEPSGGVTISSTDCWLTVVDPLGTGILREIRNALLAMVADPTVEEDVGTAA